LHCLKIEIKKIVSFKNLVLIDLKRRYLYIFDKMATPCKLYMHDSCMIVSWILALRVGEQNIEMCKKGTSTCGLKSIF